MGSSPTPGLDRSSSTSALMNGWLSRPAESMRLAGSWADHIEPQLARYYLPQPLAPPLLPLPSVSPPGREPSIRPP